SPASTVSARLGLAGDASASKANAQMIRNMGASPGAALPSPRKRGEGNVSIALPYLRPSRSESRTGGSSCGVVSTAMQPAASLPPADEQTLLLLPPGIGT